MRWTPPRIFIFTFSCFLIVIFQDCSKLGNDGYQLGSQNSSSSSGPNYIAVPNVAQVWNSVSVPTQSTIFTASFDAVPLTAAASGEDSVMGFASTQTSGYQNLAAICVFNSVALQCRNGGTYGALVAVPYTVGSSYHLQMDINVGTKTYDVYVMPQGSNQIVLAKGFSFRTEQAAVTALSFFVNYSDVGNVSISNLLISPSSAAPPPVSNPNTSSYAGCYQDSSTNHALGIFLATSGATVESCAALGQSRSLAFVGLQAGGQCWGGSAVGFGQVSDTTCNMPCTADTKEICGAINFNSIYAIGKTYLPMLVPLGAQTACLVTIASCPNHTTSVGLTSDTYQDPGYTTAANVNQAECMQRAADYYSWCASTSSIQSSFTIGGNAFQTTTYP